MPSLPATGVSIRFDESLKRSSGAPPAARSAHALAVQRPVQARRGVHPRDDVQPERGPVAEQVGEVLGGNPPRPRRRRRPRRTRTRSRPPSCAGRGSAAGPAPAGTTGRARRVVLLPTPPLGVERREHARRVAHPTERDVQHPPASRRRSSRSRPPRGRRAASNRGTRCGRRPPSARAARRARPSPRRASPGSSRPAARARAGSPPPVGAGRAPVGGLISTGSPTHAFAALVGSAPGAIAAAGRVVREVRRHVALEHDRGRVAGAPRVSSAVRTREHLVALGVGEPADLEGVVALDHAVRVVVDRLARSVEQAGRRRCPR
jgi:hypothetical protein